MALAWFIRGVHVDDDVATSLKRFGRLNLSRWIGIGRCRIGRLLPFAGKRTEDGGHNGERRRNFGDSSEARPADRTWSEIGETGRGRQGEYDGVGRINGDELEPAGGEDRRRRLVGVREEEGSGGSF